MNSNGIYSGINEDALASLSVNILDYSDSIMIKRFENKNRNTLEEMQQLKKGDKWIRAKGTFEYDSFACHRRYYCLGGVRNFRYARPNYRTPNVIYCVSKRYRKSNIWKIGGL